jgi:hypothetical protein
MSDLNESIAVAGPATGAVKFRVHGRHGLTDVCELRPGINPGQGSRDIFFQWRFRGR